MELSDLERELIINYRKADKQGKEIIVEDARMLAKPQTKEGGQSTNG